jgi:hypothetical protein
MVNLARWLMAAFHGISTGAERRSHTARRPYTGDELRAIRKRNGVGRPPAVRLAQEARMYRKWFTEPMGRVNQTDMDKALQDAVTTGVGRLRMGYDYGR